MILAWASPFNAENIPIMREYATRISNLKNPFARLAAKDI